MGFPLLRGEVEGVGRRGYMGGWGVLGGEGGCNQDVKLIAKLKGEKTA